MKRQFSRDSSEKTLAINNCVYCLDDILSGVYDDVITPRTTAATIRTAAASTPMTASFIVLAIVIPVGLAGLVLIVITFVVCLICPRRRKRGKKARYMKPVPFILNGKPVGDNDEVINLESKYAVSLYDWNTHGYHYRLNLSQLGKVQKSSNVVWSGLTPPPPPPPHDVILNFVTPPRYAYASHDFLQIPISVKMRFSH